MAFMGILLLNLLMAVVLITTVIAIIVLLISLTLFLFHKRAKKKGKKSSNQKIGAIVTLIIGLVFLIPLLLLIVLVSYGSVFMSQKEKAEERAAFEAIEAMEDKVAVKREEWIYGFAYEGRDLIPVNFFLNSQHYYTESFDPASANLSEIGTMVLENTTSCYPLYELKNDSGYKIYYVDGPHTVNGKHYSQTFVAEDEYAGILEYYCTGDLLIDVYGRVGRNIDLQKENILFDAAWKDEWIQLAHEVLDDLSGKEPFDNEYDYDLVFDVHSGDDAFFIDLIVYTDSEEPRFYLNEYEVEEELVEKHRELLMYFVEEGQGWKDHAGNTQSKR